MPAGAEIIRAEGVTKRFGGLTAVDHVDYREHEVAGIIGSNGAGKTTFFNLLTGYYTPDEGTIRYRGEDVTRMTPERRVARGMMRTFQLTATFDTLSVVDNLLLAYFRAHRQSSLLQLFLNTRKAHRDDDRIVACLETFNLSRLRDREVKHLSLGEKRVTFSMITSFGILIAGIGIIKSVWGLVPRPVSVPIAAQIDILGADVPVYRLLVVAIAVLVYVGIWLFLHRTIIGKAIRAGIEDVEHVEGRGINVARLFTLTFIIAGALSSLAGAQCAAHHG